jgi:chromosome segregation ATPase
MDARKKTIRELELRKGELLESINGILENLGKNLLLRGSGAEYGEDQDLMEYRRILKEIEDSEEHIKTIEVNILRLKEIEEKVRVKEQEYVQKNKELSALYTGLGELIMADPRYAAVTGSFTRQIEALVPKIKSLEDRLDELEENSRSNVFSWISANTQNMVLRSFLGKSRLSLQKVYMAAGEKFASSGEWIESPTQDLLDFLDSIDKERHHLAALTQELDELKSERRKIDDAFIIEGSPTRKTHGLERHIVHAQEQLGALYRNYGAKVEQGLLQIPLVEEDAGALEKIKKIKEDIRDYDNNIEKLKVSLAIDAQREEIEKMEKAIAAYRQRIAACEEGIADLEKRIDEANRQIQELMKT